MRAMIDEALGEKTVTVAFGPPSSPSKPPAAPIVDLWLSDVREDLAGRDADWFPVREEDGTVSSWQPPLRRYRLTYLLSVRAASHAEELEVLGELLRRLSPVDSLPGAHRRGWLAERTEAVRVAVANPEHSLADGWGVWSALGVPARSSITLAVTVPVGGESQQPAGAVRSRRISVQSPMASEVISEVLEPGQRDDTLARRRPKVAEFSPK
jgi:hypothetical protein